MADNCLNCKWYNVETKECCVDPPVPIYRHDDTVGAAKTSTAARWGYPILESPHICEKYRRATPM